MSKSNNLVFFGTEDFSAAALEALIAGDWLVLAVVTKPDSHSGRGQKLSPPKVKQLAQKHGIEVLQPQKVSDIDQKINALKPTHGVLVAYGKIIPQSTIDLFPGGIINIHPSLLPKYRGASPIESAILNGDKQTGISLMRLSAGMDEGPVYAQKKIALNGREDKSGLYEKLARQGAAYLLEQLPAIVGGWLTPTPQIASDASYSKLLKKDDGLMDFKDKTAEELEREVRAYLGFPRSRATIEDQEVVVTKARVVQAKSDGDLVLPAKSGYLEIEELIGPSGRKMSGKDFLHGYNRSHIQ